MRVVCSSVFNLDLRQMNGGFQKPVVDWTEDRIAAMRAMWREGMSASQIAERLGEGVTRNAVMGKLNRCGLLGFRRSEAGRWNAGAFRLQPSPPRRFSWEHAA